MIETPEFFKRSGSTCSPDLFHVLLQFGMLHRLARPTRARHLSLRSHRSVAPI